MYVLADLITAVLFHKLLNGNTKQVVTAVIKGWDGRESYITFCLLVVCVIMKRFLVKHRL